MTVRYDEPVEQDYPSDASTVLTENDDAVVPVPRTPIPATNSATNTDSRRRNSLCGWAIAIATTMGILAYGARRHPYPEQTDSMDPAWWREYPLNGHTCGGSCWKRYSLGQYQAASNTTPLIIDPHVPPNITVPTECHCREHCQSLGYSMALFVFEVEGSYPTEHPCQCLQLDDVSCLLPIYGNSISTMASKRTVGPPTLAGSGSFLISCSASQVCDYDYCDKNPTDSQCFTGNALDLQQAGWFGNLDAPIQLTHTDSVENCLEVCSSLSVAVHLDWSGNHNCLCFDEFTSCYIPWGDLPVLDPPNGTIYSKAALYKCDENVEWCDAFPFPDSTLCFDGLHHDISERGWPWKDDWHPVHQFNVSDASSCVHRCFEDDGVAVFLTSHGNFDSNCLCFNHDEDASICVLPWGETMDSIDIKFLPQGTVFYRDESFVETCAGSWCDVLANHWLCSTSINYEIESHGWPYLESKSFLETADRSNVSSEAACIQHCTTYSVAVYLETPMDDLENCLCYHGQDTCVLPWGDQVGMDSRPVGTVFLSEDWKLCTEDLDWCTVHPGHWLCGTAYYRPVREGWPRPVNGTSDEQFDATSEQACIEHCQSYDLAVYLHEPSYFVTENCHCMEAATCLLPWGNVGFTFRPSGTIFSLNGSPLEDCSDSTWCEESPDHWLCDTKVNGPIERYGWPWQETSDHGYLQPAYEVQVSSSRECLEVCDSSFVILYLGDYCLCYDDRANCLLEWDPELEGRQDLPSGTMLLRDDSPMITRCDHRSCYVRLCGFAFCDVVPDDILCLGE